MPKFHLRKGGGVTEEKALILALQRRRRALHQAIGIYTGYVTTVACRTLGTQLRHEDLEEVVSDVFLALWQHAGTLDPSRPLRPWLAAMGEKLVAGTDKGLLDPNGTATRGQVAVILQRFCAAAGAGA